VLGAFIEGNRRYLMPLGETLVNSGVITKEQLAKALEEQKQHPEQKIGEILIRLGYLPMEDLESML
jgi:hypothetical protein